MASELFDPLLDLALSVAKKGQKAKPSVAAPPRLLPMLTFAKLPEKAKDAVLDVLDSDPEFRARVAEVATEKAVGRIGLAYVERSTGWSTFVDQMLEAADEPIISTNTPSKKLEHQLDVAERARQRAEAELAEVKDQLATAEETVARLAAHRDASDQELTALRSENAGLAEQRQRAVSELKRTEEIMARHIAERKRLEGLVETMTSAQLSSTSVGGGATDEEVRASVETIEASMHEMQRQLDALRRAATPERVPVARRVSLPVPQGLLDDSVEYADYLLQIPNMTVLIDGYNVTKAAHGDWDLEQQRDWLRNGLRALCARSSASFEVIFDGADVTADSTGERASGVRIRFSPAGVEADDVIIDMVASIDRLRPLTVVSSDNRVRDGAAAGGANLLYSSQLLAVLSG